MTSMFDKSGAEEGTPISLNWTGIEHIWIEVLATQAERRLSVFEIKEDSLTRILCTHLLEKP